jgi:hypothetical protein
MTTIENSPLNEHDMIGKLIGPATALCMSEDNFDIMPILADIATWHDRANTDERAAAAKILVAIAEGWPLSAWTACTRAMREAAPF